VDTWLLAHERERPAAQWTFAVPPVGGALTLHVAARVTSTAAGASAAFEVLAFDGARFVALDAPSPDAREIGVPSAVRASGALGGDLIVRVRPVAENGAGTVTLHVDGVALSEDE
jgi:hypothetical protein